ncbi:MAG: PRC-barrel domain-containing protein [Candidatus Poseidoniaceae archaeon]|jgi:sporulation protein YlmC with PRC-barrel domain|nr:PRC-barrel domain-containing protein [Candidatus Poseidoniaceae archaeon]
MTSERRVSDLVGKEVFLPDGRLLGRVHEAVIEPTHLRASHLFVTNTTPSLVEGSVNLTVPWRWVRAVGDVVILRWFPNTPIPLNN